MQHASHEHAKTVVLTDFDHTLFNAQAFKDVLQSTICAVSGLTENQYTEAYAHMRTTMNRGFSLGAFHQALGAKQLDEGMNEDIIRNAVNDLTRDTSMYVFPDVAQFVRTMHAWDAKPVLVSYGDAEFQHDKLHGSGLEAFLPDVRFAESSIEEANDSKDALIAQVINDYPDCRFAYIDDRGHLVDRAKLAFPEMICCHMKRSGSPYAGSVSELADHELTTMQKLPYILASCLDCV